MVCAVGAVAVRYLELHSSMATLSGGSAPTVTDRVDQAPHRCVQLRGKAYRASATCQTRRCGDILSAMDSTLEATYHHQRSASRSEFLTHR